MSQQPHSTTVTLVCLDSHEWQTTATDTGMARPFAKEDGTVSPGLCLSEIPSEAGVWPANSGCCSSHASSGATEKREKSTLRSANKTESRPVGIENRQTRPWAGIAAWIATFRPRVARSGGEVRQLVVWQLRRRVLAGARVADPAGPWPVRGASWIRDNTPGVISRAGTVKPR